MFTFNGELKLITINATAGDVINVSAEDLYASWKLWVQAGTNAQWSNAFRTIGGDNLTPGIKAGAYYFIQNNDGWRIKPPEQDVNIVVTGNLTPEDSTLPIFVTTDGNFTVAFLGLQPITQNVSDLLEIQKEALFGGVVFIDTVYGQSGTAFPAGTASSPVNNFTDALAIADEFGFSSFSLAGTITLPRDFDGYTFRGWSSEDNDRIILNNRNVDNCSFINMHLIGFGIGRVDAMGCCLTNFGGVNGMFRQCGFENQITLTNGEYVFAHCHSEVAGTNKPVLNMDGQAANVSFRFYAGGLEVINCTNPVAAMTIDLTSGSVLLAPTVTAGDIVLRGVGDLTNLGTVNVVRKGFVSGEDLSLARKLLQNRQYTNPVTGKLEVWNDENTAVEVEADLFKDDGTTTWDGDGAILRRNKLQ